MEAGGTVAVTADVVVAGLLEVVELGASYVGDPAVVDVEPASASLACGASP